MRPAISRKSRLAGTWKEAGPDWITVPEILKRFSERGILIEERQLERWRNEKLLPAGIKPSFDERSLFPPETVEMAAAILDLLGKKSDLAWAGRQLWWHGHTVHDDHWRRYLMKTATTYDPVLRRLNRILSRDRNNEKTLVPVTLADKVAPKLGASDQVGKILATRISNRLRLEERATIVGLILDVVDGNPPDLRPDTAERNLMAKAFDLESSETDTLAGNRFGFSSAFGRVLANISAALRSDTLLSAASAPREEIEAVRDDVRRTMEVAPILYDSTRWIYGRKAFGLRFTNWVSRKSPPPLIRLFILIWVLMRRTGTEIIPSNEIETLHRQATELSTALQRLRPLSQNDTSIGKILRSNNLKKVFSDEKALRAFLHEIESAQR